MSKLGVLAEPVLVGRESELEELRSFLNFAIDGKGKTVFISGEAGSGKTRLAREFLKAAGKRSVAVMAGWCLSDSQVPYFPFMEAFNSYYSASDEEEAQSNLLRPQSQLGLGTPMRVGLAGGGGEITSWLTGTKQSGKAMALSPQAWKDQVFAAVSETLHTIATQGPVVLFIEDVHWADSASLALLHYVARAINNSERILVLATFRSEELTTDAEGHAHPLAETLRMMRREELFTEIKLSNLSQDSVSKIAESMMGGSLQPELAGKLTNESRGNPLFVVESLRMLHERKSLVQEDNQWRLAVDELGIPNKIKDIILRRLACLKYAQRRVLDAASVIGEEFDVELLSTVLGQDYLEILETLNVVAHSTSLVGVEGNHYRFDHARSRETLYEELAAPLKRGYHSKIAEKLESIKKETLPLSDIFYHYAQAGNKEKAVEYALAAGKDELAKYSNTQAINHFQYVLQKVVDGQDQEKWAALEGLGDAYAANCVYGEAIKTFDELSTLASGTTKLRAFRKASDAAYARGDMPDLLLEYAKKAEELGVDDRLEMARIIDNRGKAWYYAGRGTPQMDLADYNAALRVFEEENSLADVAEALNRSGTVSSGFFDNLREKGIGELLRSVAIFRELGDVKREIEATYMLANGLWYAGLFPEGAHEFEAVLKLGGNFGSFDMICRAYWYLSEHDQREGKRADALSKALKALEYSKKTDVTWLTGELYAFLTRQYTLFGDMEHADEYFDKMIKLPPELTSNMNLLPDFPLAKGVYFAAKGRWKESEEVLKYIIGILRASGVQSPNVEVFLSEMYAWVFEKQGRFEEAKAERDKIEKVLDGVEERFGHANIQLGFLVQRKVEVGEEFEMRLDMVDVGRKPGLLVKIEGITYPEFKFSSLPSFCRLQGSGLALKDKHVGSFEVETFKLKLSVTKVGTYNLSPVVFYEDGLGNAKTSKLDPIVIIVESAKPAFEVLPGRLPTGTSELDRLLYGGIPEGYAVALVSPSFEERQRLIDRYVVAGLENGQATFYLTAEPGRAKSLAEEYPSSLFLFVCNPRADLMAKDLPNIYKLKGVDSLTEIDIALTKASRQLSASPDRRRACIEIVSDVLLQHHAITTRKWLSGLIQELKSKGFTTLAVVNPRMHPSEETEAVLGLFDGMVSITEKDDEKKNRKVLKILRLRNQRYSENELALTEEEMQ
jgi:KaiC/GvpD/RAD55 family RecA-like ATPase/tetratricopeptide (TPR) repeat protein